MREVETVVGLLTLVALLVTAAQRFALPSPIALVLGGLALGFIPFLPDVAMPPDLVLIAFLPPLLFSEALTFSWREFRENLRPIGLLAFGLVLTTTVAVAATAHAVVPGLPWTAAFSLGAIVAPTDAVAASAIAKRLSVPRRIVTVLTGESLVNDAAALVVYRLAVIAVVTGHFSAVQAVSQFALSSLGGIAVGLAAGGSIGWIRRRMQPDPPVENTISLLTPFAAYLPAEALHVSGVLAVVATGLYLGRQGPRFVTAPTRLQAGAMWQMIDFLLNGILFILVGLQLHPIVLALEGHHLGHLFFSAVTVSLAVIAARFLWVFPATYLPRGISRRVQENDPLPSWRSVLVIAWTGMRGGVSLAAALALPLTIQSGAPFPERDLLIFLTFSVILSTLVIQGLTLPSLIQSLKFPSDNREELETLHARLKATQAALARLEEISAAEEIPDEVVSDLRDRFTNKANRLEARCTGDGDDEGETRAAAYRQMRQELVTAERQTVVALRDDFVISDSVLHRIQRTLDLEEQRLAMEEEDEE